MITRNFLVASSYQSKLCMLIYNYALYGALLATHAVDGKRDHAEVELANRAEVILSTSFDMSVR